MLVASALAIGLFPSRSAFATEVPVPIGIQVELLAKMAAYDRNFVARVSGEVRVLVLVKAGSAESERAADHLAAALAGVPRIGGFPHQRTTLPFVDAKKLRGECQARSTDIVYVTPGLEAELDAIVGALSGLDVLSVSAAPAHVASRVVLGFDLVSSKPKMLVHLGQARLQNVAFRSDVLKLTRVYQ